MGSVMFVHRWLCCAGVRWRMRTMNERGTVNAAHRFSDRVENYVRYRPSYPAEVVDLLKRETGLKPGWKVADVGSGTGISSRRSSDEYSRKSTAPS